MRVFVLLLVAYLVPAAYGQSAGLSWPEVTAETKPWTRWWWMGSAVDSVNLDRSLQEFAQVGFGGVEVTTIYGVRGEEAAFIPYLSPQWIDMLLYTAERARAAGMMVDMPPGSGWRTGGPTVGAEQANASLHVDVDTVAAGETWSMELAGRYVETVVAHGPSGSQIDLTGNIPSEGRLEWTAPEGAWLVYTAETKASGEKVKRPGPGGEGLTIDPFSRQSVAQFFEGYGGRMSRIPEGTLRALFHDSFEYTGNGTRGLLEAFRRRRGYYLKAHLPALMGRGAADDVARVKSDYRETVAELLREHFSLQFAGWAHSIGSRSRNQAHGSPGNLLDLYAAADIPETEVFGPLGTPDNDPLVSKFACSAAHVAGRRLCSAETGTWLGEHFTVTLDTLKRVVDQLFVSGVNHVIYHGTAYSPDRVPWPGWLFYASTQVNPRNSLWRHLPALNQYVTRAQSVLQSGAPDADVLLYWPIYDSWHDASGFRMSFAVHKPDWLHAKPVGALARALWQQGYAFDYVSDLQLAEAEPVKEGRVQTAGAEYRVVVVPPVEYMPVETFKTLYRLAKSGATVLFAGRLPADVPGMSNLAARREEMRSLQRQLTFASTHTPGVTQAPVGQGRFLTGDSLGALLQVAGVDRESLVDHPGLRFIRRKQAEGRDYFISHGGTAAFEGWLPLAAPSAAVAVMDAMSGKTGLARQRPGTGGQTEVFVRIEPGASIILRTLEEQVTAPRWRYLLSDAEPIPIRGTWQVAFVEGGPVLPPPFKTEMLGSWTDLAGEEGRRFAGTARYTLAFDAPSAAESYLLGLGDVAESARVRLNGRDLGILLAAPFEFETGPLRSTGNVLEVEVANLAANRIRDLDQRSVSWKVFHDINFVNIGYRPFDASAWPLRPSGLLGPVTLRLLEEE